MLDGMTEPVVHEPAKSKRARAFSRRLAGPIAALIALGFLTACTPSAADQDKKACQDWSATLVDFTNSGGDANAATTTSGEMSSKVIPEASPALAKDMRVIAKFFGDFTSAEDTTPQQVAASKRLGARCKAVGAPLSAD